MKSKKENLVCSKLINDVANESNTATTYDVVVEFLKQVGAKLFGTKDGLDNGLAESKNFATDIVGTSFFAKSHDGEATEAKFKHEMIRHNSVASAHFGMVVGSGFVNISGAQNIHKIGAETINKLWKTQRGKIIKSVIDRHNIDIVRQVQDLGNVIVYSNLGAQFLEQVVLTLQHKTNCKIYVKFGFQLAFGVGAKKEVGITHSMQQKFIMNEAGGKFAFKDLSVGVGYTTPEEGKTWDGQKHGIYMVGSYLYADFGACVQIIVTGNLGVDAQDLHNKLKSFWSAGQPHLAIEAGMSLSRLLPPQPTVTVASEKQLRFFDDVPFPFLEIPIARL